MAKKRFMGINPAHKGYCTPMSKPTCTGARRRLAMTLKKHHGFHKKETGGCVECEKKAAEEAAAKKGKKSKLPKRKLGGY